MGHAEKAAFANRGGNPGRGSIVRMQPLQWAVPWPILMIRRFVRTGWAG